MGQFDIALKAQGSFDFGLATDTQVSHGLNLVLELKQPLLMPALLAELALLGEKTRKALKELHFVHFARFLPLRDQSALLVITEFDGPLDPYVLDFVIAIGDVFDAILVHVKDADGVWPVRKHPQEFMDFVRRNNRVMVAPGLPYLGEYYPVYSAYPEQTVIDIVGPRAAGDLPPPVRAVPRDAIEADDVQGNILKGFNAAFGCHLSMRFEDAANGRALLGALVNGDPKKLPQVTTATDWAPGSKPPCMVNVGVTAAGLRALGVPAADRDRLPRAFLEGPADRDRAFNNGDTGDSAPRNWQLGAPGDDVHLLVSVYANGKAELDDACKRLRDWCAVHAISIPVTSDVAALDQKQSVHFGYRDGIGQPRIQGVPNDTGDDMQPRARVGEFLLGNYADLYGDDAQSIRTFPGPLCNNATFAAVRVMEQNVAAFERVLDAGAKETGKDKEWVAAKLVGRWRNGVPLALDPDAALKGTPPKNVSDQVLNNFDYAPSSEHPDVPDDHAGMVCPVGAHMRRMNPRSAMAAGYPHTHRLVRRGMPYGPAWDGNAQVKRGLYGMFFCADLERQFEFLLQQWAIGDSAASGIRGTRDPLIGARGEPTVFRVPMEGRAPVEFPVEPLVKTVGALYLLVPGINGLKYLAGGEGFEEVQRPPAGTGLGSGTVVLDDGRELPFNPGVFNPKDAEFLANPYPFYAAFRRDAPVALVKHNRYASYWVFSHELVTQVCNQTDLFLKEPVDQVGPRGLFYMDPPRHTAVRAAMNPLFADAATPVPQFTQEEAREALDDLLGAECFDAIPHYSNRVTRNVFLRMFGLPRLEWDVIGNGIDTVLKHFDQMLPDLERAPAGVATAALLAGFAASRGLCLLKPGTQELFCSMDRKTDLSEPEFLQTALHFALGGYLSTDFLVGTAIQNLLRDPARMAAFRAMPDRKNAMNELMRFDAPFQMADRFAARRTVLGGVEIPAGARVTVVYGSANHDEKVFGANADQIDLHRVIPQGQNYVFGHGIHGCIGAQMAWIVAPMAIDLLLKERPRLALVPAQAPQRYQDPYFRGFSSLVLQ